MTTRPNPGNPGSRPPRVKVCCIASANEARVAVAAGASAIGLVSAMPSGPGVISDNTAREIALSTPPSVDTFLLTSRTDGHAITAQLESIPTTTLQAVNLVDPAQWITVSRQCPHIRRVQVIHVEDESSLGLVREYESAVHAILLDSGRPSEPIAELGGTGRTHDWSISARIVRETSLPVFLAGGLRPENVRAAVTRVRPYGVDLCSGIRVDDALDESRLHDFMDEVHAVSSRAP